MPEGRECHCHHKHFGDCHEELKRQGADFTVLGVWADANTGKNKDANAMTVSPTGNVYRQPLDEPSSVVRGSKDSQTLLFPSQKLILGAQDELPLNLEHLVLKGASNVGKSRALILDFSILFFKVHFLSLKILWDLILH